MCGQETFLFSKVPRPVLCSTKSPVQLVPGFTFRGKHEWGLILTPHLGLGPSLKTSGGVPILPVYAFLEWTRTKLFFCLCLIKYFFSDFTINP